MPVVPVIASFSAAAILALGVAGCATHQPTTSSTQGTTLVETGEVTQVRDVSVSGGRTSGVGSFVGSVVGAIAGSNIGGGYGRTAAAIGGTVAGGVAGQRVVQSGSGSRFTELTVRFPNGDVRTYNVDPSENYRIGDTVQVSASQGTTRVLRQPARTQ
ncbi:MAG: glycine zipper protein [Burkholderia sp.]|nr:glycine zipper protein [Burkholderia sp.]